MIIEKTIDSLSKKYALSPEDFIKHGSTLTLRERKRNLQIERIEILARYEAETVNDLEGKINPCLTLSKINLSITRCYSQKKVRVALHSCNFALHGQFLDATRGY